METLRLIVKYVGGSALWCAGFLWIIGGTKEGAIFFAIIGALIGIAGLLFRGAVQVWGVVGDEIDRKLHRFFKQDR